jgi:uridine kinase
LLDLFNYHRNQEYIYMICVSKLEELNIAVQQSAARRAVKADEQRKTARLILVSIDGPCGSGKTTLAAQMAKIFRWQIIHMDDFFLPWKDRREDWKSQIAGNMDLARVEQEILLPLSDGREAVCRPYDCRNDRMRPAYTVRPEGIVAVEGNYSRMPALQHYYDCSIVLQCPDSVREERLKRREGSYYETFQELWMPLDERYQREMQIREEADVLFVTNTD